MNRRLISYSSDAVFQIVWETGIFEFLVDFTIVPLKVQGKKRKTKQAVYPWLGLLPRLV